MGKFKGIKRPGKKGVIGALIAIIFVLGVCAAVCLSDLQKRVEFTVLSDNAIPKEITNNVIPEYRTLERALACVVDDKVYVVVTRGEKTASGYKVGITEMKLEAEDGKETLIVYADFTDPAKENSMSQVMNYPVEVAETELSGLPDEIELRVRYKE